ncbi:hypothetical protein [Halalkalicoccus tibetensis]|uniref:DUF2382 domain-containing protein n=1 Tax=Halalkalicoccus tibetensis TaxID=175632 RepID=A0ABD5VB12_9EURY
MVDDSTADERIETTTDHETIREWVETRGSTAARTTGSSDEETGSLAIVPEGTDDASVETVPWEEFFEVFEDEGLAFAYQTTREDPDERWFCTFVAREGEVDEDVFEAERSGTTWSSAGRRAESADGEATGTRTSGTAATDESTIEEGDVAETEVTRTEVVRKEIVETDRVRSRVVESEVVEEEAIDRSLVGREIERCEIVDDAVETEVVELHRVTTEVLEAHTVESEVVDSETVERDLAEDETRTDADGKPTTEGAADLGDSGLTHDTIVESELVRRDLEEGELREGEVVETEVVERRVLESEVETRLLVRSELASGESIDERIVETELVESEIVERDADGELGSGRSDSGVDTVPDAPTGSDAGPGATAVSDDEVGKTVVDARGEEVGIVSEVGAGTLYVDPDPTVAERISSKLGWGDADDGSYPIEADRIEAVTDDEVRLARL